MAQGSSEPALREAERASCLSRNGLRHRLETRATFIRPLRGRGVWEIVTTGFGRFAPCTSGYCYIIPMG